MKKCINSKRKLPFRLCVIVFLSIVFSACNTAPKLTMEEMQDRVLISCNGVNEIYLYIPDERWGSIYAYDTETYTKPLQKHTYRGVTYDLVALGYLENGAELYYGLTDYSPEILYKFWGIDENGEKTCVHYFDEDGAPIGYTKYESVIYGKKRENFNDDDIIDVAEDFIDYFINDNSEDEIDISKYTLLDIETTDDGSSYIRYKRYVHGVTVHQVTVNFNSNCQVTGIKMSSPLLDESIYGQIPDLTDDQWTELARSTIEYLYSYSGYDATITDFEIIGELNDKRNHDSSNYRIVYLHDRNCYAVEFTPSYKAILADGTIEENPFYICYYPLYTDSKNAQ